MPKNNKTENNETERKQNDDCATMIARLEKDLSLEQEKSKRALADYQNLLRHSQQDRVRIAKLAGSEMFGAMIEPLDNLRLAATALQDKGLDLVVDQFLKALETQGVVTVAAKPGDAFDVNTMEAIEKKGDGDKIIAVISPGYILNGEVIKHAKVSVG